MYCIAPVSAILVIVLYNKSYTPTGKCPSLLLHRCPAERSGPKKTEKKLPCYHIQYVMRLLANTRPSPCPRNPSKPPSPLKVMICKFAIVRRTPFQYGRRGKQKADPTKPKTISISTPKLQIKALEKIIHP